MTTQPDTEHTKSRMHPPPGVLSEGMTTEGLERLLKVIRGTCLVCGKNVLDAVHLAPEQCVYVCGVDAVASCLVCGAPLCDACGGEFEPPICRDIWICVTFSAVQE